MLRCKSQIIFHQLWTTPPLNSIRNFILYSVTTAVEDETVAVMNGLIEGYEFLECHFS